MKHLGVALFSLLLNNAERPLAVHIVSGRIESAEQVRLQLLADRFKVPISLYSVDEGRFKGLGSSGHISAAAYLRLLMPDLLPGTLSKFLYLDCDLVVDGDIGGLLETSVEGHCLAACVDAVVEAVRAGSGESGDAGRYLNTGVMLINLESWRAQDLHHRILDHARDADGSLPLADQDALNAVVDPGRVHLLPPHWNFTVFSRLRRDLLAALEHSQAGVERPAIVHFTGAIKPWHAWCSSPLRQRYFDYQRVSPWRDEVQVERPVTPQQCAWAAEVAAAEGRMQDAVELFRRAVR